MELSAARGQDPGPAIEARGLRKSYGDRVALSEVSLDARPGEMVACIGPNGAGKTTLLNVLAGVQELDAGTIATDGARVGWVPQRPAVYGKLGVEENLRLFAQLEQVPDPERAVSGMLALSGLGERRGERLERLSEGNRQRVNVAVGMVADPQVLLLDEPTSSLDPSQRERLWEFVGDLAGAGTAVVYSTHHVAEAERFADRVLVLADGESVFWGPAEELRAALAEGPSSSDLEAAFVSFLRKRGH